jgi:hypothetical protein
MSLRLLAVLAVLTAAAPAHAQPGDLGAPGWRAGPPAEATLEDPQRYDCTGATCPSGDLACLYGVAPPRPAGSRWLTAEDVMNPDVMPWGDFEIWLASATQMLKPALTGDPAFARGGLDDRNPPELQRAGDREVVQRDYRLRSRLGLLEMPAFLWGVKGRLHTLACLTTSDARRGAQMPILGLIEALGEGEPAE